MKKCNWTSRLTCLFVVIGALNWGLVGLGSFFGGNWNLIDLIFGSWTTIESIIYLLVGVAGVSYFLRCCRKTCGVCPVSSKKDTTTPETPSQQM